MEEMEEEILNIIRKMKNEKAREWRKKNPEKVAEINKRYWINKAKKELEKKGE
jgi:hypothetical protein